MNMTMTVIILLVLLAIAALGVAWWLNTKKRSEQLQSQFGPEYGRAIGEYGDKASAERELSARQKRVEALHIVPLSDADREAFAARWDRIQQDFVDAPGSAIAAAGVLADEMMARRGYPVVDFEQQSSLLSVDHPDVVEDYRAAHAIVEQQQSVESDTEQQRQALIHYRSLVEELLGQPEEARAQ